MRGCGCPSSINVVRIETAVFALIKRAPSSASAADDIATRIICKMLFASIVSNRHTFLFMGGSLIPIVMMVDSYSLLVISALAFSAASSRIVFAISCSIVWIEKLKTV